MVFLTTDTRLLSHLEEAFCSSKERAPCHCSSHASGPLKTGNCAQKVKPPAQLCPWGCKSGIGEKRPERRQGSVERGLLGKGTGPPGFPKGLSIRKLRLPEHLDPCWMFYIYDFLSHNSERHYCPHFADRENDAGSDLRRVTQ